ncbi:SDR family oxidoreductase [Pseudomonas sp. Fig-3]|uniref:SDR family NAD(P)-dependent oxidoreductase n=1 Tax=unclassified Pseudomonas TaxID=196821 RepID=UPI0010D8F1FD|nr:MULTISPECIES: SDR family oxidoreductase [unclassified Pseudomonas]TNB81522.1 SDR family oxidoreductase [Pseudomonas sp. Fig-3]VII91644.1 Oxidoreductase, short-chain dehydrogenase/reductase family [Pseudomonas sp. FG-3G]
MSDFTRPLAGKVVLVTGGSGGIGAAIVEQLVAEGARTLIHYSRDAQGAQRLLDRMGGQGWIVQGDLSEDTGPEQLWRNALELAGGHIHGLVNNAGIRTEIPLETPTSQWRAAWRREFQVNFFAATDLCREAVAHFRANGGGRIINMASRAAQRGYAADALPYGSSKAALINLTKSLARSVAGDGIVAVAIAPGWVRTDMAEQFVVQHGEAAAVADIPIGRMASPSEIAELVAFTLRPSQVSLNGATLDVNGGSYIR